ncbi:transglutaminase-like cysteine peptidase [Fulvimarina sp. 2208YS6-2-32]|uniref:Transglutaminase-like cysteine peptidase n=1 Tax=Fulvimarina uroteuthidis TaxID=3098149 RepID=A0ABU5I3B9_9HYPH|nr:transglutaminase-like cysteine peptidase [Fulvimarina sp. 2208YS6-2-32]MDY8109706.1 transglutaminase-like cysteine peptidase [Fulvimarina sp. 2208YS6-2-32]
MPHRIQTVTAIVLAAIAFTSVADRAEARPIHMPTTEITSQPIGHYEFCRRYAERCAPQRASGPIGLNDALWNKLVEVNAAVNASIFPREDIEIHGQPDVWSYPSVEGDCEDYALLKQYMLERAGIPASNLLITVVLQTNGEGHAILTVRTDRGDLVLDNLSDRISVWNETEYTYLKRQSERHAGQWIGITDDRSILVGSLR